MSNSTPPTNKGTGKFFEIGKDYRETRRKDHPDETFYSWINVPKSGIQNSGGIRHLNTLNESRDWKDGIVLFTHLGSTNTPKPWEDIVNHHLGVIYYWGDSVKDENKSLSDYEGNRILEELDKRLHSSSEPPPFILHFTKTKSGINRFNGLCYLEKLDLEWFMDGEVPVKNYRATLRILDADPISVDWLIRWRYFSKLSERLIGAPPAWVNYVNKTKNTILTAWNTSILNKEQQLPKSKSPELKALEKLNSLDAYKFEQAIVELFLDVGGSLFRDLTKTRSSKDGGFDFIGSMLISEPFLFEIQLKGEVKRYRSDNYINPVLVSRLVARLERGQYGIFVTTSYFSQQAQEEVYEMKYPVKLIHGKQLMDIFKRSSFWIEDAIDEAWLSRFESD